MENQSLGHSNIRVSRLCFGGLTISPLQACLEPEVGAELIAYGIGKGIHFLDTAELYGLYPTLKILYRQVRRDALQLATKSYCYDEETAKRSVEGALEAMGLDYLDIFLLHEQESSHTLRGHEKAIEQLLRYKEQGLVKAIGISTHHIAGVEATLKRPEIEIVHPIYNRKGYGIVDGTAEQMLSAIMKAKEAGKGLYAMKILGGGHLINSAREEIGAALALNCFHAIALGMKTKAEIDMNVALFEGSTVTPDLEASLRQDRKLLVHEWCTGCGNCVARCQQDALSLIDGKAVVTPEKCVLCGYCAVSCPDFCIKVI